MNDRDKGIYVICVVCMLCGIIMVACDFALADTKVEKFDSGNAMLGIFLVGLSAAGIIALNRDEIKTRKLRV